MFRAILISVVTVAAVLLPCSSASAAAGLTCVSDTEVHYSPGLTLTPRPVDIRTDGTLSPCVGDGSITAGTYGSNPSGVRSCVDLLAPGTGTSTYRWNGGTFGFSTVSFNRTVTLVGGTIVTTETGTIVAGDFLGASTLFVTAGPHNPLECLSEPGIETLHTNGTLTITSV